MGLEARLKRRYEELVMGHSNVLTELAAGLKALPKGDKAFAQTQALWRFLNNPRVGPEELVKPLVALAKEGVDGGCDEYVLAIHDWSRVNYGGHESKKDRLQMTHKSDVGYELQSSVLVGDRDGAPIGSPAQNWVTKEEVLSTYTNQAQHGQTHLNELSEAMAGARTALVGAGQRGIESSVGPTHARGGGGGAGTEL